MAALRCSKGTSPWMCLHDSTTLISCDHTVPFRVASGEQLQTAVTGDTKQKQSVKTFSYISSSMYRKKQKQSNLLRYLSF